MRDLVIQDFMLVQEAAEFLRIAPSTLYGWIHTRKIPYRKHGGRVVLSRKDLEAWSLSNKNIDLEVYSFNKIENYGRQKAVPKKAKCSLKTEQEFAEAATPKKRGGYGNIKK